MVNRCQSCALCWCEGWLVYHFYFVLKLIQGRARLRPTVRTLTLTCRTTFPTFTMLVTILWFNTRWTLPYLINDVVNLYLCLRINVFQILSLLNYFVCDVWKWLPWIHLLLQIHIQSLSQLRTYLKIFKLRWNDCHSFLTLFNAILAEVSGLMHVSMINDLLLGKTLLELHEYIGKILDLFLEQGHLFQDFCCIVW